MKTSNSVSFVDKFFTIESELFELKSIEGIYYWDIFRHPVSVVVLYNLSKGKQIQSSKRSLLSNVGKLFLSFLHIFGLNKRYDNIVFADSRNQQRGMYFDQQVFGILPYLKQAKTLIVETYERKARSSYLGFDFQSSFGIFRRFFRPRYETIDFNPLASSLNEYFKTDYFDHAFFASLYHNFWKDYMFYKFIFKHMGIKRVYMSQNGIQKGLFKAAREMNVDVYEFQHGVIDKTHMAYSYSNNIDLENKVYLPTFLLKLSDYWLNNCYMPYTKQITLGNDYFVPEIEEGIESDTHKVLVISSSVHGGYLHNFLDECFKCDHAFLDYNFFFKLHPAEYGNIDNYKKMFQNYRNVNVVTNEKSVAQWMSECDTMLLIQSTSAYEALQCGKKVAILKKLSWESMRPIFQEENTHLVDTAEDFMNVLKRKASTARPLYFQAMNHHIIRSITKAE